MKKLLLLPLLLLSACQENLQQGSYQNLDVNTKTHGIVGGENVSAENPLARIVFSLVSIDPSQTTVVKEGDVVTTYESGLQCTTSPLTPKLAITAAHCVSNPNLQHRVEILDKNGKKIVNKVKSFLIHKDYQQDDHADLALLYMENEFPAETIYPELPETGRNLYLSSIIASGYGRISGQQLRDGKTGILRTVDATISGYSADRIEFTIDQTTGKGICAGDSGGPAYIMKDGKFTLVGIAYKSTYIPTGDIEEDQCNYRGRYVNVQFFMDWILPEGEKLMRENGDIQ